MNEYKDKGIKEIIARFPQVGEILEEYGIGCGPCTVGICQLQDIVAIHRMDPQQEKELMSRIDEAVHTGRKVSSSMGAGQSVGAGTSRIFSPPLQILVQEHEVIKRCLRHIPAIAEAMDLKTEDWRETITSVINFIRFFADRVHHAKEEDILLACFDNTKAIFQVIYEDHRNARNHAREMTAALQRRDSDTCRSHLLAYYALLTEHIRKEDEILFPWLDSRLDKLQAVELEQKFSAAEKAIGSDSSDHQTFLDDLDAKLRRR